MKKIVALFAAIAVLICQIGVFAEVDAAPEGVEENFVQSEVDNAKRLLDAIGVKLSVSPTLTDTVSRGDFLNALVACFQLDSIKTAQETCFYDVNEGDAYSSAVVVGLELGIVSEGTFFRPSAPVTYTEAVKMVVAALGYNADAAANGGWPSGYLIMADRLKLNSSGRNADGLLNVGQFYEMMGNMLEADIRVVSAFVNRNARLVARYQEKSNILTLFYEWEKVSGVIDGNEFTRLFDSGETLPDGFITIENDAYYCPVPYTLGSRVKGYSMERDGRETIMYLEEWNNDILTIYASDEPSYEDGAIEYFGENGRETTADLAGMCAVIYNGKAYTGYTAADFALDAGYITLVDNNNDGEYEVALVYNGEIWYADFINQNDEKIYDGHYQKTLELSGDMDSKIVKDGQSVPLSALTADSAFECYISKDGNFAELHVLSDEVSGTLTATGDNEIYIDDVAYECTQYFTDRFLNSLAVGNESTFTMTADKKVAAVNGRSTSLKTLAYAYKLDRGKGVDDSLSVKVFTDAGELAIVQMAEKVRFNDGVTSSVLSRDEVAELLSADGGEHLIRYSQNSDGMVSSLFMASSTNLGNYDAKTESKDILRRYNFKDYDNANVETYYKSFGVFVPAYFTIDSDTKIFIVKNEAEVSDETKRFALGTLASFSNDELFKCNELHAYNVSEAGRAEILVNVGSGASESVEEDSGAGVIESITRAVDTQGENALKLTICANNAYSTAYIPETSAMYAKVTNPSDSTWYLEFGDYIRYTVDFYSEISSLSKDFDASEGVILHRSANENRTLNEYYGSLVDVDNTTVAFTIDAYSSCDSVPGITKACLVMQKTYVWLANTRSGSIRAIPFSDLSSYVRQDYKIFIKTRFADIHDIVLYQ